MHQASMQRMFTEDNIRKAQAKRDDDYKRKVCLEPKFVVSYYVFVNCTSKQLRQN